MDMYQTAIRERIGLPAFQEGDGLVEEPLLFQTFRLPQDRRQLLLLAIIFK